MKLIKESISTFSKEALPFIQKHPQYKEQVKAFEQEFQIEDSAKNSKRLAYFLTENSYPNYEREHGGGDYTKVDSFDDPVIESFYYYADEEDGLIVEAEVSWKGHGTTIINSGSEPDSYYHESNITVTARAYIEMIVPQDVTDYTKYIITGDDDIEYED